MSAESQPTPDETPAVRVTDELVQAQVRRVPKYGVFLTVGVALGIVVAMILTFVFDGTQDVSASGVQYSQGQVFGFLAMVCGAAGLLIGGIAALVLDRALRRRARAVTVDHERVATED